LKTFLLGANIFDGTGRDLLSGNIVEIKDNKITYVGKKNVNDLNKGKDKIISFENATILPGLINMHDHLILKQAIGNPSEHIKKDSVNLTVHAIKICIDTLKNGITTIRDMGGKYNIALILRELVRNEEIPGPRIITCNNPISMTGGHFSGMCVEADGPDNIRRETRKQLAMGVDFIKVMASHDPFSMNGEEQTREDLTEEEISAAFTEAHKWGKKTACHVMGKKAIKNVIEAGVDIIDHGTYLDEELANLMVEKSIYYSPTLSAYTRQTMNPKFCRGKEWSEANKPLIEPLNKSFEIALKAGVKMVCSTDTTGRYAEEVELFRLHGMSKVDSLLSCTRTAAEALGLEDTIGSIEVGKIADLVVVKGNPIEDAYALEKVTLIVKNGVPLRPEEIYI